MSIHVCVRVPNREGVITEEIKIELDFELLKAQERSRWRENARHRKR